MKKILRSRWRLCLFLFFILTLISSSLAMSCTQRYHWKETDSRPPVLVPEEIKVPVDISKEKNLYKEIVKEENESYQVIDISILSEKEEIFTKLRWYRSKEAKSKKPLDFIWPILVGKDAPVATLFAENIFLAQGIDAVIMKQEKPLLSSKNPRPLYDFIPYHREMVRNLLRAIRWAKTKEELDSTRFGLTGTSYGGIVTTVCIPHIPELVSYKILMAGGGVDEILSQSVETKVVKWRDALWEKNAREMERQAQGEGKKEEFSVYLQRARAQFIEEAKLFDWDPYKTAKYIDPQKTAMVVTEYDRHVPAQNQKKLWELAGKPETLFVKTGHYTLALAYFQVQSFISEMAQKHYFSD